MTNEQESKRVRWFVIVFGIIAITYMAYNSFFSHQNFPGTISTITIVEKDRAFEDSVNSEIAILQNRVRIADSNLSSFKIKYKNLTDKHNKEIDEILNTDDSLQHAITKRLLSRIDSVSGEINKRGLVEGSWLGGEVINP